MFTQQEREEVIAVAEYRIKDLNSQIRKYATEDYKRIRSEMRHEISVLKSVIEKLQSS